MTATDAKLYAAVLYAITDTRPDMPVADRAALADAIMRCLHARGLVERRRRWGRYDFIGFKTVQDKPINEPDGGIGRRP